MHNRTYHSIGRARSQSAGTSPTRRLFLLVSVRKSQQTMRVRYVPGVLKPVCGAQATGHSPTVSTPYVQQSTDTRSKRDGDITL